MRRRLITLLLLPLAAILALAGCGSSSKGGSAPSALATELSYFPSATPFVLTLQTDPNSPAIKQAHQFEAKFPLASLGQAALTQRLQQLGLNYDTDIRPLFGHPVAIGASGGTFSGGAKSDFLIVWQAADATKLTALLKKIGIGNTVGTRDGAKLYGAGSTSLAISGSTLVFGPTPSIVTTALDRHAHGGGISNAQFTRETAGLDPSSLAEAFGDLTAELNGPSAAKAKQVPWVRALRGYGVALTANSTGLALKFHLDTTGAPLTQDQLPFATGTTAPAVPSGGPIGVGVHDPAQIVSFVEAAARQTNDSGYLKFLGRQTQLRAKTGTDINSVAGQLTGDLLVSSDTHSTMVRAAVSDPATVTGELAKLARDPHDLFADRTTTVRPIGGGFYDVVSTKRTITVGVAAGKLVGGQASPAALRTFAAAPTTSVAGAQGAVAFRVALPQLLGLAVHGSVPQVARQILTQLGDVTGWASANPSGVTGNASLVVK